MTLQVVTRAWALSTDTPNIGRGTDAILSILDESEPTICDYRLAHPAPLESLFPRMLAGTSSKRLVEAFSVHFRAMQGVELVKEIHLLEIIIELEKPIRLDSPNNSLRWKIIQSIRESVPFWKSLFFVIRRLARSPDLNSARGVERFTLSAIFNIMAKFSTPGDLTCEWVMAGIFDVLDELLSELTDISDLARESLLQHSCDASQ